jgi:hypothetical protein
VVEYLRKGLYLLTRRPLARIGRSGRLPHAVLAVGGLVAAFALIGAAATYASASYQDSQGDTNEAPDIASVTVDDAAQETVTVRVRFANFQELPPNSRVILRLDLDRNETTGAQGDEITIRYSSDGTLDVFRWDGADLLPRPATGMSAAFSDGVLAYTIDRAQLSGASSFALIAVASRTQEAGIGLVVSTDFAPSRGRNVYSFGQVSFPDPDGDNDVAPDITAVSVSDTASGTVLFRLTTANFATLPPDKLIGVGVDLRGRPSTDDELFLGYLSGTRTVEVDREQRGGLDPLGPQTGVTGSHVDGVLTFSMPRNRLDGAAAFGFGVVSADLVGPGESEGGEFEGEVEALDTAPDDLAGPLYSYRLANPGPLRLRAGSIVGSPAGPRAGKPFVATVAVRRMDTYRVVRSGSVRCTASVAGSRVPATGGLRGGRAECRLRMPEVRAGAVLRGTIVVRVSGAVHRSSFRFVVR